MADIDDLVRQAIPLVQYVSRAVGRTHQFGNLTSSIYDTAWVAMVRKPNTCPPCLLFPECFEYVLDMQRDSGGWETCGSEIDGIVNTLGALLAMKRNWDVPCRLPQDQLDQRIERAVKYLQGRLDSWDVCSCDYVGFEILVPSMLEFLEEHEISFCFPGRALLMELNQKKLAKIPPSIWSGKVQTTVTHSLEAFAGKVDFSGLSSQLIHGGMGSSPSSTAAYLMFNSEWDEHAENYLRQLVSSRREDGHGGVPGMYATTGFEVLWICGTLLDNGFDSRDLEGITSVINITDEFYEALGGLASGFSKSSVPDADDTSRSILIRNLLGKATTAETLVKTFEGSGHFLTYFMERHPSITTNCNALSAILESPDCPSYVSQVEKLAKYICASWCDPNVLFADKWNISEFYPIMFTCESLIRLLNCWDQGKITGLAHELIEERIPFVLWQALIQTLQKQNPDGSWGKRPSREITAYALITLSNLASLPLQSELRPQVEMAVENGRSYIVHGNNAPDVEYIWIAKATYSPLSISKAYTLAGLKASIPKYRLSPKVEGLFRFQEKEIQQYVHLYSSLKTLESFPKWQVTGSIIESNWFLRELKKMRHGMFDRDGMEKDKYLAFIPMCLSIANNLRGFFLKADILTGMMILILRVYQLDEYMEHIIAHDFSENTENIKEIVETIFHSRCSNGDLPMHLSYANGDSKKQNTEIRQQANGVMGAPTANSEPELPHKPTITARLSGVHGKLSALVDSIMRHPSVTSACIYDQSRLQHELRTCLLSHITQIEDSRNHYAQQPDHDHQQAPRGSYHEWVHSTGASHSCAPLSLAYLLCLLEKKQNHALGAEVRYSIQDTCMHLSNKARLENDRASFRRDRMEKNLNSVDFPEFRALDSTDSHQRDQLSRIIEYEKRCCTIALDSLRQASWDNASQRTSVVGSLEFYLFLTDVYNDVYLLRDISCAA